MEDLNEAGGVYAVMKELTKRNLLKLDLITVAIGPPTAASGETCPMDAPLEAPENLPSVISATLEPSPMPAMAR